MSNHDTGYAPIGEDGPLQDGYEKIAIYALDGEPTHAARQLDTGRWTSKLGKHEDIEHDTPGRVCKETTGTL